MQAAAPTLANRVQPRLRGLLRVGAAVALVGLAATVSGATSASAAPLPTPKSMVTLPKAAEGLQPYVPQTSCDPVLKAGVRKFRDLMLATYARGTDGGSTRSCTAGGKSEHYEGRAWDFMLSAGNKQDKATADALIAWLLKPGPDGVTALQARRFGIMYIMYNHRIWGTWDGTWKPIKSGDMHTSHIHFSFSWAGAKARTSFWTGRVAGFDYGPCAAYKGQPARIYTVPNYKPCKTNLPVAPATTHGVSWTGSTGADVRKAQVLLNIPVAQRSLTFGTVLRNRVISYQKAHKLPVTGALDKATWVKLDPKSAKPATTTTTTSSGNATTATVWVTVKSGSTGAGVLKVQKALKMPAAQQTSKFDAATLAAVKAFQKAHPPLVVDGIVGPLTAKALGLIK